MSERHRRLIPLLGALLALPLIAVVAQLLAAEDDHAGHGHEAPAATATKDEHAGHDHPDEAGSKEEHHEGEAPDEHAGHAHEGEGETAGTGLNEEQRRLFGIELAKAGAGMLRQELRLTGEIARNADRVARVIPPASGIVREVRRSVGDRVAVGELLAVLESVEVGEAKVEFLGLLRVLELADLDLARAQAVRASTVEVLRALAASPDPMELAKLNGREMGENRGRILSAYAERAAARREHEREKTLVAKKVGTDTELVAAANAMHKAEAEYDSLRDSLEFSSRRGLQDAQRERDNAALAVAAARQRLTFIGVPLPQIVSLEEGLGRSLASEGLNRVELRAPCAGTIIEKDISLGERLGDGAVVYTIADLGTVWAHLTVHARDLAAVREGTHAFVDSRFHTGGTKGEVVMISPEIDEATRTATARVVLDNGDGRWRPGTFVTAQMELAAEELPLVVPKAAVQTVSGETVVFVEHEGAFETKVVRLGRADREHVEIVAGLAAGEVYVSAGAFELKARAVTSNLDPHAGHGH